MNKTLITKTEEPLCRSGFVLNFEHSDLGFVSSFGFRYSDLGRDLRLSEAEHIAKIGDRTFETTHYYQIPAHQHHAKKLAKRKYR